MMMKKLFWLLPLLLVACQPSDQQLNGYVEGEYLMIAPTSAGLIKSLSVHRGQQIKAGEALFSLDLTELNAQKMRAVAGVHSAQAHLDDLLKGERPEKIEIILAQKEQAKAQLINARKEYQRVLPLSKTGSLSRASLDKARAELDRAQARRDELEAQVKAANLGGRIDEINGAKASLQSAEQLLVEADKKLSDAAPLSPVTGLVEDTFFQPGEFVSMGQPVVKLLPPEKVKLRFFVSQKTVAGLAPGDAVEVTCDGCTGPIAAKVSYVASQAEYTPPVIYSVESREKLVFLVEAVPDQYQKELRPGLPVSIALRGE